MLYRKSNIWLQLDWIIVTIYLVLIILGWFSIYAATYDFDNRSMLDLSGRAGMQMVWILTSLALALVLLMINQGWYETFAAWIYVAIILLLVLTVFVAPDIKGSRSWLVIVPGRFQIQPAEFAKFATALVVAKFMSSYRFEIMNFRNIAGVLGWILLPMALILLQQETGSALVFLAFFLVLYREGMPGAILFSGFSAIAYFVLDVRYADVQWGVTPAGEAMVLALIILFSAGFLYNSKGRKNLKYLGIALLSLTVLLVIAHLVLRNFGIGFNWCWPLLGFI
ncbi:MAG: rod shape-determining protein RodA, partial [Candidatus Symbiothrix sp.]|nr:rod shape-determining protein RodA [Candidatus Symbiothrix sp.]